MVAFGYNKFDRMKFNSQGHIPLIRLPDFHQDTINGLTFHI